MMKIMKTSTLVVALLVVVAIAAVGGYMLGTGGQPAAITPATTITTTTTATITTTVTTTVTKTVTTTTEELLPLPPT